MECLGIHIVTSIPPPIKWKLTRKGFQKYFHFNPAHQQSILQSLVLFNAEIQGNATNRFSVPMGCLMFFNSHIWALFNSFYGTGNLDFQTLLVVSIPSIFAFTNDGTTSSTWQTIAAVYYKIYLLLQRIWSEFLSTVLFHKHFQHLAAITWSRWEGYLIHWWPMNVLYNNCVCNGLPMDTMQSLHNKGLGIVALIQSSKMSDRALANSNHSKCSKSWAIF